MSPETPANPAPANLEQVLLAHDGQLKIQAETLAAMHKNLNDVMEFLKNLPAPTTKPALPVPTKLRHPILGSLMIVIVQNAMHRKSPFLQTSWVETTS